MRSDTREHLWYIYCGTLTCEEKSMTHHDEIIRSNTIIKHKGGVIFTVTYLQCLHLTPNIMLLRHTWHVCESQDLVENLKGRRKKGNISS